MKNLKIVAALGLLAMLAACGGPDHVTTTERTTTTRDVPMTPMSAPTATTTTTQTTRQSP